MEEKDKIRLEKLEKAYAKMKEAAKKYLQENQEVRLFHSCKANAKRNNVEFSLTIEDIIIPKTCVFLGCDLTNTSNKGRVQTNASIDRIDPTKGYTKDNIQIISDLANRMKQEATKEQLIMFAKNVLEYYRE